MYGFNDKNPRFISFVKNKMTQTVKGLQDYITVK